MSARKLIPIGTKFARLVVIAVGDPNNGKSTSVCRCECGKEITVLNVCLRNGHTKSCTCIKGQHKLQHGHARGRSTRTYRAWQNMKKRCFNPNDKEFSNYGARGIRVHSAWLGDFAAFLAYVGECPDGLTIDRINNNGNYEPGNVRWATATEQGRNKRNNHQVTVRGKTACMSELAEYFGVNFRLVRKRIHAGWPVEDAFFTPSGTKRQRPAPRRHTAFSGWGQAHGALSLSSTARNNKALLAPSVALSAVMLLVPYHMTLES